MPAGKKGLANEIKRCSHFFLVQCAVHKFIKCMLIDIKGRKSCVNIINKFVARRRREVNSFLLSLTASSCLSVFLFFKCIQFYAIFRILLTVIFWIVSTYIQTRTHARTYRLLQLISTIHTVPFWHQFKYYIHGVGKSFIFFCRHKIEIELKWANAMRHCLNSR